RQWWQARPKGVSGPWPLRPDQMFLLPGASPRGLRLPLDSLPWVPPSSYPTFSPHDPSDAPGPLSPRRQQVSVPAGQANRRADLAALSGDLPLEQRTAEQRLTPVTAGGIVRTALCVEPREGKLHVFMPPVERLEDYIDLLTMVEET